MAGKMKDSRAFRKISNTVPKAPVVSNPAHLVVQLVLDVLKIALRERIFGGRAGVLVVYRQVRNQCRK